MIIKSRSDIINYLISQNGYKRYLEIGVRDNKNFNRIKVEHKDGVDPAGKCNYVMTSNDFFYTTPSDQMYDIVFVDGLHLKDQVLKDVNNSLTRLSDGGAIVMHDCNPIAKENAMAKKIVSRWNGTTWEAFLKLRMTRNDLSMCVIAKDTGCGIIQRGKQECIVEQIVPFELFDENRSSMLGLISADEFINVFRVGQSV